MRRRTTTASVAVECDLRRNRALCRRTACRPSPFHERAQDPASQPVQARRGSNELLVAGRDEEQRAVEHEIVRILSKVTKGIDLQPGACGKTPNRPFRVRAIAHGKRVLLRASLGFCDDPAVKPIGDRRGDERSIVPEIRSQKYESAARLEHASKLGVYGLRLVDVLHHAARHDDVDRLAWKLRVREAAAKILDARYRAGRV